MRYENWLRWRASPDTPAETVHTVRSAGRKLLGQLMRQLELSGNYQGVMRQTLPDGTELVARFDGTTPMVEVAGSAEAETDIRCEGLKGVVSAAQTVADWPEPGFVGSGVGTLIGTHPMGTLSNQVFMNYQNISVGFPKSFWFDPTGPAMRSYGNESTTVKPRVWGYSPMFRDAKEFGVGPIMASPTVERLLLDVTGYSYFFPAVVDSQNFEYLLPYVNLDSGLRTARYLTVPRGATISVFDDSGVPIMLNRAGAGFAQSNVQPVWVTQRTYHQKTNQMWMLDDAVDYGVALWDYRRGTFRGPVSTWPAGMTDGGSVVGFMNDTLYMTGFADGTSITPKDAYKVRFDTGASTHYMLPMASRHAYYAQVCDTLLMVGGFDSEYHRSGDMWLQTLDGSTRRVAHIPELDGDIRDADFALRSSAVYLVPTSRCVYLFTPTVHYVNGNPDSVTYQVRTIH